MPQVAIAPEETYASNPGAHRTLPVLPALTLSLPPPVRKSPLERTSPPFAALVLNAPDL